MRKNIGKNFLYDDQEGQFQEEDTDMGRGNNLFRSLERLKYAAPCRRTATGVVRSGHHTDSYYSSIKKKPSTMPGFFFVYTVMIPP